MAFGISVSWGLTWWEVTIEKDELDGGYIAECARFPGCLSQGETEEEAVANLANAISDRVSVVLDAHQKVYETK